jgi:signal transduction histidine kinase
MSKEVRVEMALTRLPPVLGNAGQLQQVFVNLVMNAGQAMVGRSERVLTITAQLEDDHVAITFGDTGTGMTPEVVGKIFTPFFSTKPRGQGTGLGLSVSQRIVKQHHGTILFRSEPGKGTTFTVLLPVAPAAAPPAVQPVGAPPP